LSALAGETKNTPIISESSTKRMLGVLPPPTKRKRFFFILNFSVDTKTNILVETVRDARKKLQAGS
jgi:hypothetical protein